MDQCEEREEGVPPSKSTLCGEHESQTKAQRNQPGPPPSSVSLKSAWSKDEAIEFEEGQASAADRPLTQRTYKKKQGTKHKHEPEPSCVSLKSDTSKDEAIEFKKGKTSAAYRVFSGRKDAEWRIGTSG